ncbi:MAG TPA: nucleoside hydrolase [Acidimicrobiia bacterium]|nr:nucleoside hydrolase [Acidimicrobiia bacterium]
MARSIIIDTDPGQDDAIALLMALVSPELNVLGVTTVAGNVPQPQVTENALAVLELVGSNVPVFRGCARPILRELYTAEYVHGPTGIDGADLPEPSGSEADQHGVDFIIETCRDRDDVSIVALGPLTNLGVALAKEPMLAQHVQEVLWMGGAVFEGGNTTPAAEFNAYVDPHAAHIVLSSGIPLTMFPLDVTHQALVLPEHLERIRAIGSSAAEAVAGMLAYYERWDVEKYGFPGAPLHDPCPIAFLLDPDLFVGKHVSAAIEVCSEQSAGALLADWWGVSGSVPNVTIMHTVAAPGFFDLVIETLSRPE